MTSESPEHVSSVFDVFKTQGSPRVTYVERDAGRYEYALEQALTSSGLLCVLTGSSKTGKTTLYTKVARDKKLLVVRVPCNSELTIQEIWRKALEQVHYARVVQDNETARVEVGGSGELGGRIGIPSFAGITGKSAANIQRARESRTTTESVFGAPSPEHLIPLLKNRRAILVFEDYHYLRPEVQKPLFQQWKFLVDEEISVLVVGTTHHAADLAQANTDLIGRVSHIELPRWQRSDLLEIARKGLEYLGVGIDDGFVEQVAQESVGLPLITQAVLQDLLGAHGITSVQPMRKELEVDQAEVFATLYTVATTRFNAFQLLYERLARGPREDRRKFNTYEMILSTFGLDPITFSLSRGELIDRLHALPVDPAMVPTGSAVATSLRSMGSLQESLAVRLLEWNESHQRLYIIEPTFLFFLRWWKPRDALPAADLTVREMLDYLRGLYSDAVYD